MTEPAPNHSVSTQNQWFNSKQMKSIIQFKISKSENTYIAEGVDFAIVTGADTLDELVKNISEAVELHFEGEDESTFDFTAKPSILLNYEIPQYA